MSAILPPARIINHDRYPIDETDNPARRAVIDQVRAELAEDGCAVIRNFYSDAGLNSLWMGIGRGHEVIILSGI